MKAFYLIQIISVLYTLCSVGQERNRNLLNREWVPEGVKEGKWHHIFGGAMTFLFCLGFALLTYIYENNWVSSLLTFIQSGATYWLLFMVGNNLVTYRWDLRMVDYLGDEAITDRLLKGTFGRHAGKIWIVFLLTVITYSHYLHKKHRATYQHLAAQRLSRLDIIFVTDPESCKTYPYGWTARNPDCSDWYCGRLSGTGDKRTVDCLKAETEA